MHTPVNLFIKKTQLYRSMYNFSHEEFTSHVVSGHHPTTQGVSTQRLSLPAPTPGH